MPGLQLDAAVQSLKGQSTPKKTKMTYFFSFSAAELFIHLDSFIVRCQVFGRYRLWRDACHLSDVIN